MNAAESLDGMLDGCFGVRGLRVVATPEAQPEDLLDSATLLLASGLAALDGMDEMEIEEVQERYWPAVFILRQAAFALSQGHSRLLKRDGRAAVPAHGGAV